MRKNYAFWLLWGAALLGISGCGMSEAKQRGTIVGAALGAAALGVGGVVIADEVGDGDRQSERWIGAGMRIADGALLGGTIGYLLTEQPPPPSPPPPTPPPSAPTPPPAITSGTTIRLRGVNFDYDKATIRPDAAAVL